MVGAGLTVAAIRPTWIDAVRLRPLLCAAIAATALGHWLLLRPTQPAIWALDLIAIALAAAWAWTLRARPQLSK